MELKKVFSTIGAVALGLSLTTGAVFAGNESSTGVSVSVLCSTLSDVTVESQVGGGAFDAIDIANGDDSTQTVPEDLLVTVDVGCELGPWHVDAEVSRFQDGGILHSFAGDKFSLEAGSVTADAVGDGHILTQAPTASDAEFSPISGYPIGDAGSDAPIFKTTNIVVFGWDTGVDYAAPFVSTAAFTGHLDDMGGVAPGDYSATLTVILTND